MNDKITKQLINDYEGQLRAINRSQAVIQFNLDGTIISANQNFLDIMGYSLEEIQGKHHSIFVDPEYAKSSDYKNFWDKLNLGEFFSSEFKRFDKNGKEVWIQGSYNPIYDMNKQLFKIVKYVHNITDRKTIEQKYSSDVKQKDEQYDLVLRSMSVGVWDWEVPTNKLYWSQRFKDMVGITDKNFIPHYNEFADRLHPDDKEYVQKQLFGHLENHTPYNIEYRFRHNNGSYIWIHAFGQAQWDSNGKAIRMAGSVNDISDRKNAQEEILKYMQALEISNHNLDEFSYIASHDLKEPLRGISNNAQFLKEDYTNILDKAGIQKTDRIIFLCERMEQLMNELLTFSKIGKEGLAIKSLDLNKMLEDIKDTMETKLLESNVKINIPKKLPTIICDYIRITEVFRNLITNAIKYNNKKEKIIEIGFNESINDEINSKYIFYVKDNGIGIAEKHFNDIFRIFKRLNDENDQTKGSGVGLTFVKKIIERHKGKIWLESKSDVGTIFHFYLEDHDNEKYF